MIAAVLVDILGLLAVGAVCAGMLYLASRIEPHWVSKDQRRFLTVAQEIGQDRLPLGRKHEVRVYLEPDDEALLIRRRSMVRPGSGIWHVHAKSAAPPKGREVYFLKRDASDSGVGQMALRFPARSSMIPRLDELLAATGEQTAARRPTASKQVSEAAGSPADDDPTTSP